MFCKILGKQNRILGQRETIGAIFLWIAGFVICKFLMNLRVDIRPQWNQILGWFGCATAWQYRGK